MFILLISGVKIYKWLKFSKKFFQARPWEGCNGFLTWILNRPIENPFNSVWLCDRRTTFIFPNWISRILPIRLQRRRESQSAKMINCRYIYTQRERRHFKLYLLEIYLPDIFFNLYLSDTMFYQIITGTVMDWCLNFKLGNSKPLTNQVILPGRNFSIHFF